MEIIVYAMMLTVCNVESNVCEDLTTHAFSCARAKVLMIDYADRKYAGKMVRVEGEPRCIPQTYAVPEIRYEDE